MSTAVVNLGLKSIRCIVFDADGKKLASASEPVHTRIGADTVEQSAGEWLELLQLVVPKAIKAAKVHVTEFAVTASASCLVLTDASGQPVAPVVMVSDRRAGAEADDISSALSAVSSSVQAVPRVTPDLMLPKLLWWVRHNPAVINKTRWAFSPADFLIFHLTGRAVTDPNNASKFLALKIHSKGSTWAYPHRLLSSLGVDERWLPEIVAIGTNVGTVVPVWVERLGLLHGVSVYLATYDALCALIGSGVSEPGTVATVFGTVTSVRAVAPLQSVVTADSVSSNWPEPVSPYRIVGASNNLGGGLIEWHKQAFYADTQGDLYRLMDEEVSSTPAGAEGLLMLPYLLGERAPIWDPSVRGIFFGLSRVHQRRHFTRGAYEAVAFSTRHILESLFTGDGNVTRVISSGGLARSRVQTQVLADVLQLPVFRPLEFETTSIGAAIIANWGASKFSTIGDACATFVQYEPPLEPHSSRRSLYDEMFHLYVELYRRTGSLTDLHASMRVGHPDFIGREHVDRDNL